MQLDLDGMSKVRIYDLLGKPKVWYLDNVEENGGARPRYLIEPANMADLEVKYRTGKIAIDTFSASHRAGDVVEPQIFDTHYTAPEVRFLRKSAGLSSDIWSLASTIHIIRTTKLLLARLDSRSSLVAWLAWAYGAFPQSYWNAIGSYLSDDSAVPVFTVNAIPQKPPVPSKEPPARQEGAKADGYSSEWGRHRGKVIASLLGEAETPRSIEQREMLQDEKDRSKYLRIKLPKNSNAWTKLQEQRKRHTGFQSLLHEDLSKERQWYEETEALNDIRNLAPTRLPSVIDDATLQRLNSAWAPEPAVEPDAEEAHRNQGADTNVAKNIEGSRNINGKRALGEEGQEAQPNPKKAKRFIIENNLRDRVECIEQKDGMTKFSYRLQRGEVDLLAGLLCDMLWNDPDERISIDVVLQHEWFAASRKRLE